MSMFIMIPFLFLILGFAESPKHKMSKTIHAKTRDANQMKLSNSDGITDDSLQPHIMIIIRSNRLAININIFLFCFVQRILNICYYKHEIVH